LRPQNNNQHAAFGRLFNKDLIMAIKKSVRLTDPTIEALRPFSDVAGEGMNWSGSINAMAEHVSIIVNELTPDLSANQWSALYCCYNGYMPHPDPKEEARLLAWHVSEGYQCDAQVAEFLGAKADAIAFIDQLNSYSLPQRLCIIYFAKAFWRKGPVVDSPVEDDDEMQQL
jgi:hypothetical protein